MCSSLHGGVCGGQAGMCSSLHGGVCTVDRLACVVPVQYIDAVQNGIHCTVGPFDPPTQHATIKHNMLHITSFCCWQHGGSHDSGCSITSIFSRVHYDIPGYQAALSVCVYECVCVHAISFHFTFARYPLG